MVSNSDGVVSMVEDNVIDLGVVETPVTNKSLTVELCSKDQLVAVVHPTHKLAKRSKISSTDLISHPYISREEGSGTRGVIAKYLENRNIDPSSLDIIMELGSPESIKGAVAADMGIAILSRATLHKELKLGLLKAIPLDPPLERNFSFVHQKQKFRLHAMEELSQFVRNYCHNRNL
jgi:DNA-binding transcriptional LysR family regulator